MAEQEINWDYTSSGDKEKAKKDIASVAWTASEYIDHKQGASWYLMLMLATIVLAAVIYLLTKDIFAVVITALLGLIVGIFAHRTPKQRTYELDDSGLKIDGKFYPYHNFKSFSVIQEGPLVSLELISIKRFMPTISVYFSPNDQEKIISVIQDHLAYEQRRLEAVERLSRSLRF